LWNPELSLAASFNGSGELAEWTGANGGAVARFFGRKPLASQYRCWGTSDCRVPKQSRPAPHCVNRGGDGIPLYVKEGVEENRIKLDRVVAFEVW
jgi:hypothetical protein